MNPDHNQVLQKYHITPAALLSKGMEAEVYAYGADTVLKCYAGTTPVADLRTLQDFYAKLDRTRVPYALPQIHSITQEADCVITIEQRLTGNRMVDSLPGLTTAQMDTMMQRYLTAVLAVGQLAVSPPCTRYKLFDPEGISQRAAGDWHHFLTCYLNHKLVQVTPYLARDVLDFTAKVAQLRSILAHPYAGGEGLIHGDFFPGNLLVDANGQITALLDFGLMTMQGDVLFDLATSWLFFDMYDELQINAVGRYLAILIEHLGEKIRGRLYRYALVYSILSANMYSNCSDGHYRWCVANLNQQHYWNRLE